MAITNLLPFLQSSAGSLFDDEEFPVQTPGYGDDIQVTGRAPQVFEDDPMPMNMGNVSALMEAQAALENSPERKGMFGIKGTLRDVLGTLGDAFLVQAGGKEGYAPQRQREKTMDALGGFTQNPLAAIERLSQTDPEAAVGLFKQMQAQQAQQAALQRQQSELQRKEAKDAAALKYRKIQIAQNMMNAAATAEEQNAVREWLSNDDADLENLPAHIMAAGGINRSQQEQIPFREQQLEIARQNAAANTTRANREPQGRAPSVNADVVLPLLRARESGQQMTPEQEEVLTRAGFSANRGQGRVRRGTIGGASSGGSSSSGFRIVGSRPAGVPLAQ